ncbi:peptide-methionine (S)-S-oxide reductase [Bacillus tianshenii]|nr:peptide-methionine (S)-S-oxide reductase [Bacillus tianshenii]
MNFGGNHQAMKDRHYKGRQYLSILLYHDEEQRETGERVKREWEQHLGGVIQTEIQAYSTFYLAEDYHQKYFLKRFANATAVIQRLFPNHESFVDSTIAARLNGFVKGFGKMNDLKQEIENWGLREEEKQELLNHLVRVKW